MEPYSPHAYPAQPDRYPPAPEPLNRYTGRTPSPTPSEVEALTSNILNVKRYLNWRFWARKEWIGWYILFAVILVVSILIGVYDKQIVHWLTPAGNWMKKLPAGWLIPIAILFIISFPPLFGHEIVAILVGVIWGLGLGFAIVAAGTFIGEIGNYYAFKYCCRARGEKMERDGISYACLARVVREGGFKVALVIRLSVIPGHFSTAVFSTCGMGVVVFALAAFFSLPKQLVTVYIGVVLQEGGSGTTTSKDTIISDLVLVFTTLLTFVAGYYIYYLINNVKPAVIYERRKARQVKIAGPTYAFDNTSVATLYPTADSDVDLPLRVIPQSLAQPQARRNFSGNYAGHGGYTVAYDADADEERKPVMGWETGGSEVEDMRGARWGARGGAGEETGKGIREEYEEGSEESGVTIVGAQPALPPALQPPPPPPQIPPPILNLNVQPDLYGTHAPPPQHKYELSDPPVVQHTPLPSDASYPYSPSLNPQSGYAQTDVYPHSGDGSHAGYAQTDVYPQSTDGFHTGHAVQSTDATGTSYYSHAGPPGRDASGQ